jgi:hypothetical protein
MYNTQGLLPIQKGDFFSLFWRAWGSTFTTNLCLKAFEATGIHPPNADVILKRFKRRDNKSKRGASVLLPEDWRQMERLVRAAVRDTTAEESQKLSQTLHQLQVSNELLRHENSGLKEALTAKKSRKAPGKALELEYHSGATFWSPSKFDRAREREAEKQHQEEQEMLQKANKREL